jgi:hypothetical protein
VNLAAYVLAPAQLLSLLGLLMVHDSPTSRPTRLDDRFAKRRINRHS